MPAASESVHRQHASWAGTLHKYGQEAQCACVVLMVLRLARQTLQRGRQAGQGLGTLCGLSRLGWGSLGKAQPGLAAPGPVTK